MEKSQQALQLQETDSLSARRPGFERALAHLLHLARNWVCHKVGDTAATAAFDEAKVLLQNAKATHAAAVADVAAKAAAAAAAREAVNNDTTDANKNARQAATAELNQAQTSLKTAQNVWKERTVARNRAEWRKVNKLFNCRKQIASLHAVQVSSGRWRIYYTSHETGCLKKVFRMDWPLRSPVEDELVVFAELPKELEIDRPYVVTDSFLAGHVKKPPQLGQPTEFAVRVFGTKNVARGTVQRSKRKAEEPRVYRSRADRIKRRKTVREASPEPEPAPAAPAPQPATPPPVPVGGFEQPQALVPLRAYQDIGKTTAAGDELVFYEEALEIVLRSGDTVAELFKNDASPKQLPRLEKVTPTAQVKTAAGTVLPLGEAYEGVLFSGLTVLSHSNRLLTIDAVSVQTWSREKVCTATTSHMNGESEEVFPVVEDSAPTTAGFNKYLYSKTPTVKRWVDEVQRFDAFRRASDVAENEKDKNTQVTNPCDKGADGRDFVTTFFEGTDFYYAVRRDGGDVEVLTEYDRSICLKFEDLSAATELVVPPVLDPPTVPAVSLWQGLCKTDLLERHFKGVLEYLSFDTLTQLFGTPWKYDSATGEYDEDAAVTKITAATISESAAEHTKQLKRAEARAYVKVFQAGRLEVDRSSLFPTRDPGDMSLADMYNPALPENQRVAAYKKLTKSVKIGREGDRGQCTMHFFALYFDISPNNPNSKLFASFLSSADRVKPNRDFPLGLLKCFAFPGIATEQTIRKLHETFWTAEAKAKIEAQSWTQFVAFYDQFLNLMKDPAEAKSLYYQSKMWAPVYNMLPKKKPSSTSLSAGAVRVSKFLNLFTYTKEDDNTRMLADVEVVDGKLQMNPDKINISPPDLKVGCDDAFPEQVEKKNDEATVTVVPEALPMFDEGVFARKRPPVSSQPEERDGKQVEDPVLATRYPRKALENVGCATTSSVRSESFNPYGRFDATAKVHVYVSDANFETDLKKALASRFGTSNSEKEKKHFERRDVAVPHSGAEGRHGHQDAR
ncbi:hypothetical protein DIPPA_08738 [Diplonema papillatum]|nr:hypothetical protein DIPPA_08738 [Diplonema papillatum]